PDRTAPQLAHNAGQSTGVRYRPSRALVRQAWQSSRASAHHLHVRPPARRAETQDLAFGPAVRAGQRVDLTQPAAGVMAELFPEERCDIEGTFPAAGARGAMEIHCERPLVFGDFVQQLRLRGIDTAALHENRARLLRVRAVGDGGEI